MLTILSIPFVWKVCMVHLSITSGAFLTTKYIIYTLPSGEGVVNHISWQHGIKAGEISTTSLGR